jgi:hypothetical protein
MPAEARPTGLPGWRPGQSADMGELGEFYLFQMPEIDSLLELLYVTELPPPEKTIG